MADKIAFHCQYCNRTVMVYPSTRGERLTCGAYQCVQRRYRDKQAIAAGKEPMDRTPKTCPYCDAVYTPMQRDQKTCGARQCTTKWTHDRLHPPVQQSSITSNMRRDECVICARVYYTKKAYQRTCGARECQLAYKHRKGNVLSLDGDKVSRAGMVKCIRSNDLYAAGKEYIRAMVIADIRTRQVPREDFKL